MTAKLCTALAVFMSTGGGTIQGVAQGASVSTQLVIDVRKAGQALPNEAKGAVPDWIFDLTHGESERTRRFKRARASSLAKLYYYIEIKRPDLVNGFTIQDALKDFGLHRFLDEEGMQDAQRVVIPRQNKLQSNSRDPIVSRLYNSDSERIEINAKIFEWSPFSDKGSKQIESAVLGKWITERWLNTINPGKWFANVSGQREEKFSNALSALRPFKNGPAADVIFGLYDTAARRLQNVEFVNFPGIAASLGAVIPVQALDTAFLDGSGYDKLNDSAHEVSIWSKLLWDWDDLQYRNVKLLTYMDEVGDLFVKGACGIQDVGTENSEEKDRNFHPIDEVDTIFDKYIEICRDKVDKKFPIFVADQKYCHDLQQRIQGALGNNHSIVIGDRKKFRYHDVPVPKDKKKRFQKFIDNSSTNAPTYEFGMAVSSHATKFKSLLENCLYNDIMTNAPSLAGLFYGEMLFKSQFIRVTEIGDKVLGKTQRHELADKTIAYLKMISGGNETRFEEEIKMNWKPEE